MSASEPAIELRGLTKLYGAVRALDGVDLAVPTGSVFGFLGPNGAGKSTALNILAGLAWPTSGTAHVLGRDVTRASSALRAEIGYLPDVPGFYGWMTADEFLRFAGRLCGVRGATLDARVDALLELAGLRDVRTRVGGFSRGMRQRLGLAQALINAPRLLLLDEPTSALDPLGRKDVLDMLAALAGRTTIFFSTHILADVERVCDTIAILDRGRVIVEAPTAELRARRGADTMAVELGSAEQAAQLVAAAQGAAWLGNARVDGETARLAVHDLAAAQRALPAIIAARGLSLRRLDSGEASLEDVFVQLVGEPHP